MIRFRWLRASAAVAVCAAGAMFVATEAQAAVTVRVESQITDHDLPYRNSPYINGSALAAAQYASVECQTRGREYVGDTVVWYRVNAMYYPAYAFAPASNVLPCGVATNVPLAANGYSSPSFYFSGGGWLVRFQ